MTDFIGLCGVSLVVYAYFLLQTGQISTNNVKYSIYNFVGSLLIIFTLMRNFNLASFTIEAFWVAISVIGLVRYYRQKRKKRD